MFNKILNKLVPYIIFGCVLGSFVIGFYAGMHIADATLADYEMVILNEAKQIKQLQADKMEMYQMYMLEYQERHQVQDQNGVKL